MSEAPLPQTTDGLARRWPKLKRGVLLALRWAWLLLIFAAVTAYLVAHYDVVAAELRTVSPLRLAGVLALMLLGRLCMIHLAYQSIGFVGERMPYRRLFYAHSISQLAKYIPGSVWQFVGRAGYYRADGVPLLRVSQALVIENLWLVLSSGFMGFIVLLPVLAGGQGAAGALILALAWVAITYLLTRWRAQGPAAADLLRSVGVQAALWLLMGASLALLLPLPPSSGAVGLVVGSFSIGWLIGFVTVFAPGGIGVREAVLVALLLPLFAASESLAYVTLHRFLWVFVDVLMGLLAWFFFRQRAA